MSALAQTGIASWRRSELLSAVFCLALINGLVNRIVFYVEVNGFSAGVFSLFGISALVIICVFLSFSNLFRAGGERADRWDWAFAAIVLVLSFIPTSVAAWIALSLAAMREIFRRDQDADIRRASILMLAATVPLFWGRMVFTLFSSVFLKIDAVFVSWLTGSDRLGNVIYLQNGSGILWIADACSSFQNISLAMLCWVMFMEYRGRKERTWNDYWVCILACVNVVVINVARISIIALRPDYYDAVHGPYGAAVAGYLSTFVVLVICATGIKRDTRVAA